jgi:hypothetical protein
MNDGADEAVFEGLQEKLSAVYDGEVLTLGVLQRDV